MKAPELINRLKERLPNPTWKWRFSDESNELRIEQSNGKGLTLFIPEILAKYQQRKDAVINEYVYIIKQTIESFEREEAEGFQQKAVFYPVIRSTSFPTQTKEGVPFIHQAHTAETAIFFALDTGATYRLVDEEVLKKVQITEEQMKQQAFSTVKNLPTAYKLDEVAGNYFYFINYRDGYDATRILNDELLHQFEQKIEGDMTVSVPHQDVLLIGDIRNQTGYDVLAQMTMHFFTKGAVPITSLSFIYEEGQLEPIFILAKNRPAKK